MSEYAIDREIYNIFDGLKVDEKKIRDFLITFHELLDKKNETSKETIKEQKAILKAELKDELTKELATKADIVKIEKDIENLNNQFKQIDKRFEQIDKRFESVDKKFDSMILRMDRFMFWSLGLTITSTLFIIGFIFKFFGN